MSSRSSSASRQAIFLTGVGLGWALDEAARHEEALELARSTRDRLRAMGADARFGGQLASKMARALFDLGRWDEAARVLDETIAGSPNRYAMRWLLSNRIQLSIGRGRLGSARRDILTYEALGERVVGPDPDLMSTRRAELAVVSGEPIVARQIIAESLARLIEPELDTDARRLMLAGLHAEAEEADAARSSGDVIGRRWRSPAPGSWSSRCAGTSSGCGRSHPTRCLPSTPTFAGRCPRLARRGEVDHAIWEAAVPAAARSGARTSWRARSPISRPSRLSRATAGRGRRRAGRGPCHAPSPWALAPCARRSSRWLAARASASRASTPPRTRPTGWASRRASARCWSLLADGRINRQIGDKLFMAESTAGVHVSNILGKLGVTRRSEAAAVAHRLGLFLLS